MEPGFEDYVCKLVHTIYGTMQGAHNWYETLINTYNKLGYTTSQVDPCVRYKKDGDFTTTTPFLAILFVSKISFNVYHVLN